MPSRTTGFDGLEITYDDEVLEPRPWTVEQARWAAALLEDLPAGPVLELCSGAGQIGLAVARRTGRALVQVDVDEHACALARANAAAAGVDADVRRVELELAVADGERFPLVLADPPYVPAGEVDALPEDPDLAVDGGDDGLDVARTCLQVAAAAVVADGVVLLQLGGPRQSSRITEEAGALGLEVVEARTHGPDRSLVLLRRRG